MSIILFISLILILLATLCSIILFIQAQDKRIVVVIGFFSLISTWLLTVAITETEQWFPIKYSNKVVEVPGLLVSVLSLLIVIVLERVLADKVKRELLQSAILESQQALDKKSEFIAVMSHEIRTPLNTIIGINELLVDTKLTIYQKKLLEQCCLSGTSLQGIIEDILNLSEIEAGFLTLNNESYNLTDTVERLVRQQKFSVQKKGLLIDVEFQSTVSGNLFGDRRKISQVLLNLITNATKYTHKGCISIKVSTEFISEDKVLVFFRVFDTGMGIPEAEEDKLFTWFSRLDSARTSGTEGTGLGLAICKNLVDFMGGEIGVESRGFDEGSCFWFSVEQGMQVIADSIVISEFNGEGKAVCGIYGSEIERRLLSNNMAVYLDSAEVKSIDEFQSQLNKEQEQMDFLFICLSESMENIESTVKSIKHYPCMVQAKIIYCGPMSFKVKRFCDRSDVIDSVCLLELEPKSKELIATQTRALSKEGKDNAIDFVDSSSSKVILLVDDSAGNQIVISAMLESMGYEVISVNNGEEALQVVMMDKIDLILMDVSMPIMDGYQTTRHIRELSGDNHKIPIIAVTAHANKTIEEQCYESGMNDYLNKPIVKSTLKEKIQFYLSRDDAYQESDKGFKLIDDEQLHQLQSDCSPEMFTRMLAIFTREVRERLALITAMGEKEDLEGLQLQFHTLGGTASTYGAVKISDLSFQAEQFCKDKEKVSPELVKDLQHVAELTLLELSKRYCS